MRGFAPLSLIIGAVAFGAMSTLGARRAEA
jgi:hypothetical protein